MDGVVVEVQEMEGVEFDDVEMVDVFDSDVGYDGSRCGDDRCGERDGCRRDVWMHDDESKSGNTE
eukprot:CAMPEP_0194045568 /NCGR_PEP_ID=MMETSP0009_2-20130614/16864_1 /TAXON_ID=210454 /ORGANISM="Grammatophora oceanica, Strain CCMP 410" /LENGTH=64 /DNA_ID=CAMNT_0038690449 /DNA_START=338 /DNA_END=532 /DNA_ORIENTATION=-